MPSFSGQMTTAIAAFLVGCLFMFYILRPEKVVEQTAAEIRHDDGALTLAKDPGAAARVDAVAPVPTLPPGKHTRTILIKVQPKPQPKVEPKPQPPGDDGMCIVVEAVTCPAVTVRLDITETPEGSRVTASSPDGEIFGGLDVPRTPLFVARELKWAAGVAVATTVATTPITTVGGFIDRDWGPFRTGLVVLPGEAHVKFGLRF